MTGFLHSPFTVGACLLLLYAWVFIAIFCPQKGLAKKDEPDARF